MMVLGKEAELFTGVLYNTYSAPPGFCFDALCHDEPIIDDKNSPEYNADRQVGIASTSGFYNDSAQLIFR